MLISHKIIDALLGHDKKYTLTPVPGLPGPTERAALARRIEDAPKFDFGDLMLERKDDNSWALPKITTDEREFWRQGLIPLPFPVCWYEWTLNRYRSGLLVYEREPEVWTQRLDLVDNHVLFDGVIVKVSKLDPTIALVTLAGNPALITALKDKRGQMAEWMGANAPLAIYLTLMINSRSTEISMERAPARLNAARRQRGHTPLADHRVVRIVPHRFRTEGDSKEGTHASPRLHWRRSHLRHYDRQVPTAVWSETVEHEERKGWWVAVIPRCLVGKAELGEVSHEYWIPSSTKKGA